MIPFNQITEELLLERANELPESITDVLLNPATNKTVTDTCEGFGIKEEEKLLIIRQLVAFVLLGFIRDYDLWSEIDEALALKSPSLAREISIDIGNKLFAPIKEDLVKNYKPLFGTPTNTEKLIQFAVDRKDGKPEPIKDIFERISTTSGTIPGKLPTPQKPISNTSAPSSTSSPNQNTGTTSSGPVFLHKESLFEPIKTKTDFRLQFPGQKPLAPSSSSQPQRTGPAFRIDLKPKAQEPKPSLNTPLGVPASSFAQSTVPAKPFTQDIKNAAVAPKNTTASIPPKPISADAPMPPTPAPKPAQMPIPITSSSTGLNSVAPKLQIPMPTIPKTIVPMPLNPNASTTRSIPTAPTPPRSFATKIQDKITINKMTALPTPSMTTSTVPVAPQAPLPPTPPRPTT